MPVFRFIAIVTLSLPIASAAPNMVGLWEFDDDTKPLAATVGQDLELVGSHETGSGYEDLDGACTIAAGSHYRAHHGIALGEGQRRINTYSLVIDFRTSADSHGHALIQTDPANADDAELQTTNREGVIGAGFVGWSPQWSFKPGEWYRLIVCADLAAGRYDVYLNGTLVVEGAAPDMNGRYSLDPDAVLFFANDDEEDKSVDVSRISIYDGALSEDDVKQIGYLIEPQPDNKPPRFAGEPIDLDAKIGEPVSLTLPAIDDEYDAFQYRLTLGNLGALSPWLDADSETRSVTWSHAFRLNATYPLFIELRDEFGAQSPPVPCATVTASGPVNGLDFVTAPYTMSVTSDGITIMWEANELLQGLVNVDGKTFHAICEPSGFDTFIFTAEVTGLKADTPYTASVLLSQPALQSSELSTSIDFKTAPAEAIPFTFAVWSDSQGHNHGAYEADPYEPTNSMFNHMVAADVDFGVACGDMAEDGGSYDDTRKYFLDRVARHLGAKKPFLIAWGNHDDYRGAILRKFASFPSKDIPGYDAGYGSFSYDYAGCHFVCIDYATEWVDIFHWVEQDLDAHQDAKFTFLFIHEPPYCELWIDGESTMRAQLVPLLERYGVDAVFSGHTHEYERGYKNGVYYCITGGGSWLDVGEPVVKDWPHMTVGGAQDLPGFKNGLVNEYVQVSVGEDSWKAEAIAFQPDGKEIGVIDTFGSEDKPGPDELDSKKVTHAVYFWLSHELTDEQVAAFKQGLETLRGIDGVESLSYGEPLASPRPIVDDSYSLGLTVVFRDQAALDAYLPHPIHQELLKNFSSYFTKIQVYDYR